ncbi:histidine phosphatase family protein [Larkinella sp. GY13]|uniref:histidine phosphatase family protein n=1 Tax=Larkinella sp. GY13 TaxID=3453720 RepID=UPI003EED00A9
MPTFYLIRHAESEGNQRPHLICGRSNHYLLSNEGIAQSEKLGRRLKEECIQFKHWFSSPAERTVQTASIIGRIANLPQALLSDQLQEQWMGDWEGQLRAQIYTEETVRIMSADNWHFKDHNGESQFEVENRMYDFISPLLTLPSEVTVGIVTHGMAIKCLLRKILDSSPAMTHKIQLNNTSLTILRYTHSDWHIERVNDYSHLLKFTV